MARGDGKQTIMRRGVRLLWYSVRAQAGPFAIAIVGAALFSVMAVGGTVVLGRITDDVLTPGFEEGGVERQAVAIGAIALVAASALRMVGVVLRRYFGQMAQRRMQVTVVQAGHRPLPRRAPAVVRRAPDRRAARPRRRRLRAGDHGDAAPSLLARRGRADRRVDGAPRHRRRVLFGVAVALFPGLAVLNNYYTKRVEEPAAVRPSTGRRRVERRPRELRGRPRREDARARGPRGGADAASAPRSSDASG